VISPFLKMLLFAVCCVLVPRKSLKPFDIFIEF